MGLFKSDEERRIERDLRIRQGIRRIEKAIREQGKFQDELIKNAQRAKKIGDGKQYAFIRNSLKKTATFQKLLERQLLSIKNALVIKKQAEASAQFSEAMGMMATEIGKLFGNTDLVKSQVDWEKAMVQSATMEERMDTFLDTIEDVAAEDAELASEPGLTDEEVDRLIEAESQAEHDREMDRLSGLRAELESLKKEGEKTEVAPNGRHMASYSTFERLKTKGVAAYQKGDYLVARGYLVEAAECMLEMAAAAKTPELRIQHEEYASELIDLAKDCKNHRTDRKPRGRTTDEGDSGSSADDWIVREIPDIGFDDIAGLEDVKNEIRLKMIHPLRHPELARRYGIQSGGGVLLYGPPGTGKTMMAKAIACELQATFFLISPAQILSKWVGEAEQNLRKLFDAARSEATSIIFMDEIEAAGPRAAVRRFYGHATRRAADLAGVGGFDRARRPPAVRWARPTNPGCWTRR